MGLKSVRRVILSKNIKDMELQYKKYMPNCDYKSIFRKLEHKPKFINFREKRKLYKSHIQIILIT